jgi:hypothetical protein
MFDFIIVLFLLVSMMSMAPNDPKYNAKRKQRLRETIQSANKDNETACITVSRIDRVVLDLSKEFNIPILKGVDEPKGKTCFWCPVYFSSNDACCNIDCAMIQADVKHKLCGACRKVKYCSLECQKLDWKNHKPNCIQH